MNLLFSALMLIFLPFGNKSDRLPVKTTVTSWQCGSPQWVTPGTVSDNVFRGKIKATCNVLTPTVSAYDTFYTNLIQSTVEEAEPLHAGPVDRTFENMASKYFDLTLVIDEQGLHSIRSDVQLAWDKKNLVVIDSKSKAFAATGLAANITKLDARVEITRKDDTHHQLVFLNESHIKRPALIPLNVFRNRVIDEMEKQMKTELGKSIKEIVKDM